ncbi:hypothetical protein KGA65_01830 [Ideonella sp. B7]|uniref:glycosyl transferase family 90 n=1 Tax=Ideonella benzenivorans TaxID=2831643 RepID=UPI001CEDFE28|nr:glycosyl transferase family 90 [Ideonella benzenivorans]MCA6215271.1 hypothetical protein [Ideonella benzenivorans]
MAWLDDQLDFRWADISPGRTFALTEAGLVACRQMAQMGVLDPDTPCYFPTARGEAASRWDDATGAFVESHPETKRPLARRQARFGNLVRSWKLHGLFMTNWSDGQPWDYTQFMPELQGTPVLQFARKRAQRGQVVLLPLGWYFMGPGSTNLPLEPDPIPFEAKTSNLIWRGRISGTIPSDDRQLWWAASSFMAGQESRAQHHLPQTARWRVAHALRNTPWADVKLILSAQEQTRLDHSPILQTLLDGLVGQRRTQAEHCGGKFLLVIDGNDIGTNKYWSLLSNSVTLMVDSEWETALDAGLEPWVHYVPVPPEREAIEATVDDLLRHPRRCLDIIRAAHALLQPQLDVAMREAADYATLRRYEQQVICTAGLPTTWSLARR